MEEREHRYVRLLENPYAVLNFDENEPDDTSSPSNYIEDQRDGEETLDKRPDSCWNAKHLVGW